MLPTRGNIDKRRVALFADEVALQNAQRPDNTNHGCGMFGWYRLFSQIVLPSRGVKVLRSTGLAEPRCRQSCARADGFPIIRSFAHNPNAALVRVSQQHDKDRAATAEAFLSLVQHTPSAAGRALDNAKSTPEWVANAAPAVRRVLENSAHNGELAPYG